MPRGVPKDPGRRQRRVERTREQLLDAAHALFLERGYHPVVLSDVSARADLGTGTLYLHYRDKHEIYEALARRHLASMRARWIERAQSETDAREQVLLMVEVAIAYFAEHRAEARLFLLEGPAVESWLVEEVGRAIAAILTSLRQPELAAHLLIGAALGAGRFMLQQPDRGIDRKFMAGAIDFCRAGLVALEAAQSSPRRRRKAR
ncbi:MAG TPA: helix-turn-helix domain-containing protein [Polyangiaceae bacterium]|jgi:AcrR family transcriptional regulator|nr:helix-turn-helix domain-containing protein [Polyangiaceae bacterium]